MWSNSANSSISATSAMCASSYSRKSPIVFAASVPLSASTAIGFAARELTRAFSVRTKHRVTLSFRFRGARLGSCAVYKYGLHDFAIGVMITKDTFQDSGNKKRVTAAARGTLQMHTHW